MRVSVGMGSCGIAAGADRIYGILSKALNVPVFATGCNGACYCEPIVTVGKKVFTNVDEKKANEIIELINSGDISSEADDDNGNAKTAELKIALRNCGVIDPENIEDYIENGGYKAAEKCIKQMTPEEIIAEVKTAGIGGRGGAGFPTWFKWDACRKSTPDAKTETKTEAKKYIICNADEGDPGAFMDRAILEGDPHSVIEGMIIGARAMGCGEGIIYVRAEYPLAITRLEVAIKQATEKGFLGSNIMDSDFSFSIRIKAGAGAFVCGEETALIASLEGERGMPRLKPPFPAQKGFWQMPSNINNVETFANIAFIINGGGEAFSKIGTENSKGTKVFALTGKIKNGGLVEVPMGVSIRDVVYEMGGGLIGGKSLKAVQLGGPSGGCIPERLIDTPIDYKSVAETGAIMGSGGMVIMDETTCMVDMARYFLDFTCKESCGKCTHCRIGNKRMLEILDRICNGEGREGDIELLEELGNGIKAGSLCALGQSAPNPVLTTIRYFRNEYEDHINGKCTAKQCKPLISYEIDEDKCTGCTLCARRCPSNAIEGAVKKTHCIDKEKCTKCGICKEVCKFKAVNLR